VPVRAEEVHILTKLRCGGRSIQAPYRKRSYTEHAYDGRIATFKDALELTGVPSGAREVAISAGAGRAARQYYGKTASCGVGPSLRAGQDQLAPNEWPRLFIESVFEITRYLVPNMRVLIL
jgi:hypothetical protein